MFLVSFFLWIVQEADRRGTDMNKADVPSQSAASERAGGSTWANSCHDDFVCLLFHITDEIWGRFWFDAEVTFQSSPAAFSSKHAAAKEADSYKTLCRPKQSKNINSSARQKQPPTRRWCCSCRSSADRKSKSNNIKVFFPLFTSLLHLCVRCILLLKMLKLELSDFYPFHSLYSAAGGEFSLHIQEKTSSFRTNIQQHTAAHTRFHLNRSSRGTSN